MEERLGMGVVPSQEPASHQAKAAIQNLTRSFAPIVRTRIAFTIYSFVALACIFFVPYLVPSKPSASLSYAFGFNNHAGILLLLWFCGIGALWLRQLPFFPLASEPNIPVSRRTLLIGLLLTAFLCALAYPLVNRAIPIADAAYMVNRIRLLQSGRLPYVDFEYAYGPVFLYVPLWIANLFPISLPTAYYVFWVINELVGILIMARVLNAIDIPTSARPTIFLLFCWASGAAFIVGGINYTFFRFALAPFLALEIREIELKLQNRKAAIWIVPSLIILAFAILLSVSPEIALSFGVAFALFLALRSGIRTARYWMSLFMVLTGIAGILLLANRAHLLDTMKNFAGGSRDFPMVPSAHLFLFMICVFLATLHLARSWPWQGRSSSCLLILVSVPMLASALGSCEPLHVFYSGIGFLAVGLIYLSRSHRSWELARIVFVFSFVMGILGGLTNGRLMQYAACLEDAFGKSATTRQISQAVLFPQSRGILQAPFGFGAPSVELYDVPWVDFGRFYGVTNAPSIRDIDIKENELNAHPNREVLVPMDLHTFGAIPSRRWLEVEFGAPYFMPLRHADSPYSGLVKFVQQHYHKIAPGSSTTLRYELWARN